MFESLEPMIVRHFLLDFRPTENVRQTWVLNAPTLLDQQMLYNNVGTCSRGSCRTLFLKQTLREKK